MKLVSLSIIDVNLDPYDTSPALERLGRPLRKGVKGKA